MQISGTLTDWFNSRWGDTMGAIDGQDLTFIAGLIAAEQPRSVVEIGVASGLSTACLANLLDTIGPGSARLDSFDLAERFYVDPSLPVGYLLAEGPPHPGVEVRVHTGSTALDVAAHVQGPIDLCFIDAAHRHPWPLIDTLAILPLMRPGGIIVHHDLKMYLDTQATNWANGPKVVLDHVPEALRIYSGPEVEAAARGRLKCRTVSGNIFALRVPQDRADLEWSLAQGFYLGWDPQRPILVSNSFADRFAAHLAQHHGSWIGMAFAEGRRRYSHDGPDWAMTLMERADHALRPIGRVLRRAGLRRG